MLEDILAQTNYFHTASTVAHMDTDTDLDPIRTRDDFQAFLKRAREGIKAKAAPTTEKPMPTVGK